MRRRRSLSSGWAGRLDRAAPPAGRDAEAAAGGGACSRDRAIIPVTRRASARVSSSFQERVVMAISLFAVIASIVAVVVVVLVVLRITLGAGRYGREYDRAAQRLHDRPDAEARNESDSESTS